MYEAQLSNQADFCWSVWWIWWITGNGCEIFHTIAWIPTEIISYENSLNSGLIVTEP